MYDPDNFQNPHAFAREKRPESKWRHDEIGLEGGQESLNEYIMKEITEETKVKDLIPEGWEQDSIRIKTDSDPDYPSLNDIGLIEMIIKKKQKTLEDYENKLLYDWIQKYPGEGRLIWSFLKQYYLKQFYSIILKMIADDICDTESERISYIDRISVDSRDEDLIPLGVTLFDTEEHAEQARKIMGDKINHLL